MALCSDQDLASKHPTTVPKSKKMESQQAPPSNNSNLMFGPEYVYAPCFDQDMELGDLLYMLTPIMLPHLDEDKALVVHTLSSHVKDNEITEDRFLRMMLNIVRHEMLIQASEELKSQIRRQLQAHAAQESQTGSRPLLGQTQASLQQEQKLLESQTQTTSITSAVASAASSKPQIQDSQMGQVLLCQDGGLTRPGRTTQHMTVMNGHKVPNSKEQKVCSVPPVPCGKQEPLGQAPQLSVPFSSTPLAPAGGHQTNAELCAKTSVSGSMEPQSENVMLVQTHVSSTTPPLEPQSTAPRSHSIGQKKPFDAVDTLPPVTSKKQKVFGALPDLNIPYPSELSAVTVVNLQPPSATDYTSNFLEDSALGVHISSFEKRIGQLFQMLNQHVHKLVAELGVPDTASQRPAPS